MAQEETLEKLLSACKLEDEDTIRALIEKSGGTILTAASVKEKGLSALHYCTKHGKVRALDILLSAGGVVVDMKDKGCNTALHVAADNDKVEALKRLLSNEHVKKLINCKNADGHTALLLGVDRGYENVCKVLLEEPEIDVQAKDGDGWSAVHNAVVRGFKNVVAILHSHKSWKTLANEATADENRQTPLHLAASFGRQDMCSLLLSYSSGDDDFLSTEDADGSTALFHSLSLDDSEATHFFLKLLQDRETALNHQDKKGKTALHKAIARKNVSEDLLESWINMPKIVLEKQEKKGQTVLHVACRYRRTRIVKVLLKANKELACIADHSGKTALHEAARLREEAIVELLLQEEADRFLFLRDGDGRTALHWVAAAKMSDKADSETPKSPTENPAIKIATRLLEKADGFKMRDLLLWASAGPVHGRAIDMAEEESPIRDYLQTEMDEVIKSFRNGRKKANEWPSWLLLPWHSKRPHAEEPLSMLQKAIKAQDYDSLLDFINRGADINELDKEGKEEILKQTLRKKTDQPTAKDSLGRMDLHKAIATLILNPFTGTPITIGILGKWGSGKSSTMLQVEFIIFLTLVKSFLMKPEEKDQLLGSKEWKLTVKGRKLHSQIVKQIKNLHSSNEKAMGDDEKTLQWFFEEEWQKHYEELKGLALADRSELVACKDNKKTSSEFVGEIPALLIVSFNAWLYETKEEASAGLALEITRQMEQCMTPAQWLQARFFHACNRNRVFIYQKLLIPLILFLVLGGFIAWIILKLLSSNEAKSKTKEIFYGSIPVAIIVILWRVLGNIFSALDPISAQLAGYRISKEHEAILGHRQTVIDDIRFLKKMICEKPGFIWKLIGWLWELVGHGKSYTKGEFRIPRLIPPKDNLRVVVFIDDLDRCKQDTTYVLDVLRAINMILAVCEINVVLGVDKEMLQNAIESEFEKEKRGSRDFAEKFLQKIIQLPLHLPDPSVIEMTNFLRENIDDNPPDSSQKDLKEDSTAKQIDSSRRKQEAESSTADTQEKNPDIHTLGKGITADKDLEKGEKGKSTVENASKGPRSSNREGSTMNGSPHIGSKVAAGRYENPHPIEFTALVAGYNSIERDAFKHLVAGGHNQPREWKHFLNYHRFACNVLSHARSKKVRRIDGWRRQLIVWVFVCWRWKDEMNEIIQNWKHILKQMPAEEDDVKPSLSRIISKYRSKTYEKEGKEVVEGQEEVLTKAEKEKRWKDLCKIVDEQHDVSMDAICAFQKFRFHCKTGYLAWDPTWSQHGPQEKNHYDPPT